MKEKYNLSGWHRISKHFFCICANGEDIAYYCTTRRQGYLNGITYETPQEIERELNISGNYTWHNYQSIDDIQKESGMTIHTLGLLIILWIATGAISFTWIYFNIYR